MRKINLSKLLSSLIAIALFMTLIPQTHVHADTQFGEYKDPAEHWINSGGRADDLELNAKLSYETAYCGNCERVVTTNAWRVPEYTRTGETALNRGVMYSDGTMIDGVNKGNLDSGLPGVNSYYTGHHWSATRS